jgi:hypothetical protein
VTDSTRQNGGVKQLQRRLADFRMSKTTSGVLTAVFVVVAAVTTSIAAIQNAFTDPSPPVDYDVFGRAGHDILTLHWDRVFTDPALQAGPFELIFYGVPHLLGVQGALGWSTFYIVAGSLLAAALGYVVWRLVRGIAPDTAAPIAAAVAALAAASDTIQLSMTDGHPAQIAVPILWLVAAMLARKDRAFAAAVVLGLSLGWELWGILGVPVLLLAPRVRLRTVLVSAAGGLAALTVTFGGFVLAGPVTMFGFEWPVSDGSLAHLLLPDIQTFGWPLRLIQAIVSVGAGVVVARVLHHSWDAVWLAPLAVCAVRLTTDPVIAGYYFCAAVILIFAGLALALATRSLFRFVATVALWNVTAALAGIGWIAAAILTAMVAVTVMVFALHRRFDVSISPAPDPAAVS